MMGRLRHSPLLAVRYRKLVDEYGSNKDLLTFLPASVHEYLQYSCTHCGHIQKLQAEELNTIVGNAFRMAYAAQLQKRSTGYALNDVIADVIRNSDQDKICKDQRYWGKHKVHGRDSVRAMNALSRKTLDHTNGNNNLSGVPLTVNMNVPSKPQSLSLSENPCSVDACTPGSEESNSPTELNSCRRLRDKPPLVKRLPMGCVEEDKCPLVNPGYINERNSQMIKSDCDNRLQGSTLTEDDTSTKRISQSSNSSSGSGSTSCTLLTPDSHCGTRTPTPPHVKEAIAEESDLKTAAWFQAGIPREIALEVLKEEPVGAFLVRGSASKPGCYALSLRVPADFQPSGIAHYLIMRTHRGYKIKGFMKEFSTLTALITHHSVMPELLPCPLSLARYNPAFTRNDNSREFVDIHDPDYNTLTDFARLMADMNV